MWSGYQRRGSSQVRGTATTERADKEHMRGRGWLKRNRLGQRLFDGFHQVRQRIMVKKIDHRQGHARMRKPVRPCQECNRFASIVSKCRHSLSAGVGQNSMSESRQYNPDTKLEREASRLMHKTLLLASKILRSNIITLDIIIASCTLSLFGINKYKKY